MQINSCCCCLSLKTGTIIIGICGIILSIVTIILMLTTNLRWETIVFHDLMHWAVIFMLCMTVLISTLLIIGAVKEYTFLMLPWVILGLMMTVSLLISVIYTAVIFFIREQIRMGIFWIIFGLLSLVIYVYLWFVVFSYFQKLRIEKNSMNVGPYGRPYNYSKARQNVHHGGEFR